MTAINIPTLPPVTTFLDIQRQNTADLQRSQNLASQISLRKAQAQRALSGGQTGYAPGAGGIVQGLEVIKKQYGDDSPEYARAKRYADITAEAKKQKGQFYGANLRWKNASNITKLQDAVEIQKKTGLPLDVVLQRMKNHTLNDTYNSPNKIETPGSQTNVQFNNPQPTQQERDTSNKQAAQTEALIGKKVGSAAAQAALPPLLDLAKTVNNVDFAPVAKFAGTHGQLYAMFERGKVRAGLEPSADFKAYDKFVGTQAPAIADQTRLALQTSVKENYVRTMITPLVNPAIWKENPELAMNRFNYFRHWINDRMKLYHYAATQGISPDLKKLRDTLGIGTQDQTIKKPTAPAKQQSAQSTNLKNISNAQLQQIARGG